MIPDLVGDLRRAGRHEFVRNRSGHIAARRIFFSRTRRGRGQNRRGGDRRFEDLFDVGQAKGKALFPVGEAFGVGIAAKRRDGAQEFGGGTGHGIVNTVNDVNT